MSIITTDPKNELGHRMSHYIFEKWCHKCKAKDDDILLTLPCKVSDEDAVDEFRKLMREHNRSERQTLFFLKARFPDIEFDK